MIEMDFEKRLAEDLANLHPTEIDEHIVRPAVKQIIEDCQDYLRIIAEPYQLDTIQPTRKLLNRYLRVNQIIKGE